MLIPAIGVAAFAMVVPITIALLVVLGFLILSYLQTIKAYPTAGGAYIVTRDNFGLLPAQVAGVALLTDYILTVAVSVAAGTAALGSAAPALAPYSLEISIAFVVLIAYGNLRGVRESGRLFAVPTYFFILNMVVLLGIGLWKLASGTLPVSVLHHAGVVPQGSVGAGIFMGATLYVVMHAFASGGAGGHRCRGDLERRAGLPRAVVEERPHHARDHGLHARRDVPRLVDPGRAFPPDPLRERHADRHQPDRAPRLRRRRVR